MSIELKSQATNKEVDFPSQQHFKLLWCLMPTDFIVLGINTL